MLGALVYALGRATGQDLTACLVRRTTGIPCPSCGATRAGLALLSLDPLRAASLNPLVSVLDLGLAAWIASRVLLARRIRVDASRRQWTAVVVLALAALVLNWAYVLATQR